MYRTDDTLSDAHAETLQARALARLRDYAEAYDVPVLLTRTSDDEFTAPFETIADQHLECPDRDGPAIRRRRVRDARLSRRRRVVLPDYVRLLAGDTRHSRRPSWSRTGDPTAAA